MVNIVEKYIQNKDQLIILISGFSGSGKTLLAKNIERDFKISFLNLNDFYKKDYINIVDLGNDIKVNDWDNPDAVDWESFNAKVKELKTVVISGFGFPNDRIEFKSDFHIYLRISKQKLLENRHNFLEENKDNPLNDIKDTKTELLILNSLSYKHYMEIKEKSTYTLNTDVTEKTPDTTYDEIFDYLIKQIEKSVYNKN
jgi:broad-specificity NMP kinase